MTKDNIVRAIEIARDRFLKRNPSFSTASLKGRNHIRRTSFISWDLTDTVRRYAYNNLANELAGSFGQSQITIYPTEFVEYIAEELDIPLSLLVNQENI
jgi:hypothetical protein